jgi:Ca2+-binding RTX toxin-like protein
MRTRPTVYSRPVPHYASLATPLALLVGLAGMVTFAGVKPATSGMSCFGKAVTISGTSGSDHIDATDGDDVIFAGGGNDDVQGREGSDRVCGGGGNDELHGGEGRKDWIKGSGGDDFLDGRRGVDRDVMVGGGGQDEIVGGNILRGGRGKDYLEVVVYAGDPRRDTVTGGPDDDRLRGDGGGDRLKGGSGTDNCSGAGPGGTVVGCE